MNETFYRNQLREAMTLLGKDSRTVFIGQTVAYPGSRFTFNTLSEVPMEKRFEVPIMEEVQMGCYGLSFLGQDFIPVSIYPRVDFLWPGMNQLANHLDKIKQMSNGEMNPHVIIRATIGSTKPLNPGPQHSQDHSGVLERALENIHVKKLVEAEEIVPEYVDALKRKGPSLLIDDGNLHFNQEY
tara:strand:- start:222 stop:773 length:552 start_codon:yes stop_codon:yes gene_type:complete